MVKINHNITGTEYIRNYEDMLAVGDEDNKTAWTGYYEKSLNTEFVWDRKKLSHADTVRQGYGSTVNR